MKGLRELLERTPPGQVPETGEIDRLLADCWDALEGANEGGMAGYKLLGRMESVEWQPPTLTFVIERHGGTVCGSTRAELQHWLVDLNQMTATITKTARRQLEPMAERMPIKAMAQELAQLIIGGKKDDWLQWNDDGSVKVQMSRIFPSGSGYEMTIQGRRRQLRRRIDDILAGQGWVMRVANVFQREVEDAPPFFKCPQCGCTDLGVTLEYDRADYYTATVPCECGRADHAAVRSYRTVTLCERRAALDECHQCEWDTDEEIEKLDEEEDDYEVFCPTCLEAADGDDWEVHFDPSESEEEITEVRVWCAECGREIEFGWSHPDRGGRIWPAECPDFNPWKCWPEPRFQESWQKRGWLRPSEVQHGVYEAEESES